MNNQKKDIQLESKKVDLLNQVFVNQINEHININKRQTGQKNNRNEKEWNKIKLIRAIRQR